MPRECRTSRSVTQYIPIVSSLVRKMCFLLQNAFLVIVTSIFLLLCFFSAVYNRLTLCAFTSSFSLVSCNRGCKNICTPTNQITGKVTGCCDNCGSAFSSLFPPHRKWGVRARFHPGARRCCFSFGRRWKESRDALRGTGESTPQIQVWHIFVCLHIAALLSQLISFSFIRDTL